MASAAAAPILVLQEELGVIELTHGQIARRAYEIWEREGKVDGKDQHHWFQAMSELRFEAVADEDDEEEDDAAVSGLRSS